MVMFTTRLVDNRVFEHDMFTVDGPALDIEPSRLVAFTGSGLKEIRAAIEANPAHKLRKLKSNVLKQMTPDLLNGFIVVGLIVIVYAFLYYRYHQKKENLQKQ